jgi:hypothetical protein
MDYYLKPSEIILSFRTLGTIIYFIFGMYWLFGSNTSLHPFLGYCWLILSIANLLPEIRLLYIWSKKDPVLTANQDYIFDRLNDRKYYWEDIESIVYKNDYLKVILNKSPKHSVRPYNRFIRFMVKVFSRNPQKMMLYYVYINVLDTNRDEFLETFNNFSIQTKNKS